ncbi:MAG: lytic transglycosylase domain-containing protein [Fibrobacter sp.]|nr:lytic transglycosylase domain-containing protein [Fibrobacter sp.]
MKTNFRLSSRSVLVLYVVVVSILMVIMVFWLSNLNKQSHLLKEEQRLRTELLELEEYGKWTLDYIKIERGLNFLSKNKISEWTRIELTDQIWKISRTYNIDPMLILGIVAQESHGNPRARGRMRSGVESGAFGLMQIKVETAKSIGKRFGYKIENEEDLMDPEVNVVIGAAYLMRLIARYENLKHAIIAYNIGHGRLDYYLKNKLNLPNLYYERVISKYWNLVSGLNFLDLER